MIPWECLDRCTVPGSTSELRLMRRGAEYSIMLGSNELMNSRLSGSEIALASLAAENLPGSASHRVLIGGLGMGFTLRAALEYFGETAIVTVAELVPSVAEWAKTHLKPVFGESIHDSRVNLHICDVFDVLRAANDRFDAILLDVDNGPDGITHPANDRLYALSGLKMIAQALRSGGVLAVWSEKPDHNFSKRLFKAGFKVQELTVRANKGKSGARHHIWLART